MFLGYHGPAGVDSSAEVRDVTFGGSSSGDGGWLLRFFDSAFFCEWIAVSYLYKYEHGGVRDYLCNRMYSLPQQGMEGYLFQLCYMLIHKPSPSLDRYVVDLCSKSLRIAIKVHWFLLAEIEDTVATKDKDEVLRLQAECDASGMNGLWATPWATKESRRKFNRKKLLASLPSLPSLASSTHGKPPAAPGLASDDNLRELGSPKPEQEGEARRALRQLMLRSKLRESGSKLRESVSIRLRDTKDSPGKASGGEGSGSKSRDGFWKRLWRDKGDEEGSAMNGEGESAGKGKGEGEADKERRDSKAESASDEEKLSVGRRLSRRLSFSRDKMKDSGAESLGESADEKEVKKGTNLRWRDKERASMVESSGESSADEKEEKSRWRLRSRPKKEPLETIGDSGDEQDAAGLKEGVDEAPCQSPRTPGDAPRPDASGRGEGPGEKKPRRLGTNGFHLPTFFWGNGEISPREPRRKSSSSGAAGAFSPGLADPLPGILYECSSPALESPQVADTEATSPADDKPKLPRHPSFSIRTTGTFHATLDFVRALCDASSGLADVFPISDRQHALRQSLAELNGHLEIASKGSGVCFPLGSPARIIHIPIEEAVLLNSRDKAPFMICVEVYKYDDPNKTKGEDPSGLFSKNSRLLGFWRNASGGGSSPGRVPWVANGGGSSPGHTSWSLRGSTVDLRPTEDLLKASSDAIDTAMSNLWHASPVQLVEVGLTVGPRRRKLKPAARAQAPAAADSSDGQSDLQEEAATCSSADSATVMSEGLPLHAGIGDKDAEGRVCSRDVAGREPGSSIGEASDGELEWVTVNLRAVPGATLGEGEEEGSTHGKEGGAPARRPHHRRVPSAVAMEEAKAAARRGLTQPAGVPNAWAAVRDTGGSVASLAGESESAIADAEEIRKTAAQSVMGEHWAPRKERVRRQSKFGKGPEWDLRSVIVKSGDDCRQEHLAAQLVRHFHDIFGEAGLPLWLRPYEVLVTSSRTALIETIPDAVSIHAVKSRLENGGSLRDHFVQKYLPDSPAFKLAQRNFVESMAGYSILCYLLQVKDRHNGNILLDEDGHVIHIDFGFMLSNSPGSVNFESAPFKLTRELLEVMDSDAEGTSSEPFNYFKLLCIHGFLACRKHAERILLLIEMMQNSGCPCFKGGARAVANLRKRFALTLTEQQCVSLVLSLISSSLDAWRTRQYDYYQRVLNGIL